MGKKFRSEKEKKRKDKKTESKSDFKAFLKKRAPIYLGLMGLFILFVVPEFTKSNLESSFPENLTQEENQALQILMSYDGDNDKGLTLLDALSNQIEEEYPNEKIYDNKDTKIDFFVSELDIENSYQIELIFESYKGKSEYVWNVFLDTEEIQAINSEANAITQIVDYYD